MSLMRYGLHSWEQNINWDLTKDGYNFNLVVVQLVWNAQDFVSLGDKHIDVWRPA